jgi:hypothetical protein
LPHTFNAVNSRQIDVHKDDIRRNLREVFQCFLCARVMAEAFEAFRAIEDARKCSAQLLIVLNNGNSDRHSIVRSWREHRSLFLSSID